MVLRVKCSEEKKHFFIIIIAIIVVVICVFRLLYFWRHLATFVQERFV